MRECQDWRKHQGVVQLLQKTDEIAASFNGGPKTDADTTLMDNFDKIQVLDKTRTNTTPDGKIKGIISGTYEKVLGKYGNALKLSSEK